MSGNSPVNRPPNWPPNWEDQKPKFALLGVVVAIVLVVDQITKYFIYSRFRLGESIPVIADLFSITYVRNTGAAFGLFHRAPTWFRDPFFIVVPVIALIVISTLLISVPRDKKLPQLGLALIFSGAIGNLIDRVRFGYVVDFLDVYWKEHHWPAFNVADSCIVVGVGIVLLLSFFEEKHKNEAGKPA